MKSPAVIVIPLLVNDKVFVSFGSAPPHSFIAVRKVSVKLKVKRSGSFSISSPKKIHIVICVMLFEMLLQITSSCIIYSRFLLIRLLNAKRNFPSSCEVEGRGLPCWLAFKAAHIKDRMLKGFSLLTYL